MFNPLHFHARNELFVGRFASIGLVVALIGERLTGKGALAQLNMETHLPVYELQPLFLLFVGLLATSSVVPLDSHFVGPSSPAVRSLGIRYTTDRQRLLGRLSMAAFASALVAEALTGSGPLDLLELDTGVPMDELEAMVVFFLLLLGMGDESVGPKSEEGAAEWAWEDAGVDWCAEDHDMEEAE